MTRLPLYPYPLPLMAEYKDDFPRDWFEFPNPENPAEIFKCDLTWLTSYWNCTFGRGCQGIDKKLPDHGCCSDGAYYYSEDDEKRVTKAAKRLTKSMWQNYDLARKGKSFTITELGLDKDRKTKKVNNTCIFFNERSFSNEYFGCALHHLAEKENNHYIDTKPDICWQLPLRRSWEKREVGDEKVDVVVIGEYTRKAWGEGGADLDWYCTSNTEAHNSPTPVYLSQKAELVALMNQRAYEILKEKCDLVMKSRRKSLPLFVLHPASR
jgi:hypothetical protein